MVTCADCPQGYWGSGVATAKCDECGTGTYGNEAALTSAGGCKQCPAGTFSGALTAVNVNLCNTCAAGLYGVVPGRDSSDNACVECPTGYHSEAGSTGCVACAEVGDAGVALCWTICSHVCCW